MAGTAGAIRAGQAFIEIGLNNDPLTKGLKAAESQLKSFGIAVTQIGAAAGAAGAAITVPLLAMAKTFAEGTSALQHMSERTGISIEALSALAYAAKQTGIDLDTVEGAVRKMQKALTAGSLENQQAAQTFERLGLNVKALEQLKPEKAFEILADRISKIPNENARAGAAMLIFGKTGTSILPLIENMAALTKEAKDFGLVASTKGVEAGTRLQHAFNLLDKSIAFTQGTIASSLAPTLTEMNAAFARNLKTVREWIAANKPLVLQAFQIGLALTAVGTAFATLGAAFIASGAVLGGVATTLAAVGAALAALTSPISLVIAAIAGLGTWFLRSTETGQQSLAFIGKQFQQLKAEAIATFGGIADALKAGDIVLAGQILWTGLQVEWLKGKVALLNIWDEWGVSMVAKTIMVKDKIVETLTFGWDLIGLGLTASTNVMLNTWDTFVAAVIVSFNNMIEPLQIGWALITTAATYTANTITGIWQATSDTLVAVSSPFFALMGEEWNLFTKLVSVQIGIIRGYWETFVSYLGGAIDLIRANWDKFIAAVQIGTGPLFPLIEKLGEAVKGAGGLIGQAGKNLAGNFNISAAGVAVGGVQMQTQQANDKAIQARDEAAKKRQDELAAKAQAIEDARVARTKELIELQKKQLEDLAKGSETAWFKAAEQLEKLQGELKAQQAKAKEKAGKLGPLAEEKKQGKEVGEPLKPEELDKSIEDIKKNTVDVKGSFSAAAVQSFGIGDTLSEAVKENGKKQEKTNEKLDKIHEKLGRQQAVFAPA
jgi:hypothetical protein